MNKIIIKGSGCPWTDPEQALKHLQDVAEEIAIVNAGMYCFQYFSLVRIVNFTSFVSVICKFIQFGIEKSQIKYGIQLKIHKNTKWKCALIDVPNFIFYRYCEFSWSSRLYCIDQTKWSTECKRNELSSVSLDWNWYLHWFVPLSPFLPLLTIPFFRTKCSSVNSCWSFRQFAAHFKSIWLPNCWL